MESNNLDKKVQRPTDDQFRQMANKYDFHFTEEEIKDYQRHIDMNFQAFDFLNMLPDNLPEVKYPRTAGYFPSPSENKFNAWYVKSIVKGASEGKLAGRQIVLKDNVCLAGVPMMVGCSTLEGYVPEIDATLVTRILDAGGTIVGKANCENLCISSGSFTCDKGPVHNPHKHGYIAGGSSSGTAALVASSEVEMGIGSDTAGSIRVPACWSGCYGMKPTYGLVPCTGVMAMENSLDHAGPMTANVLDNALLLEVIAGPDGLDPKQHIPESQSYDYTSKIKEGVKGMKIGIVKEGFGHKESEKKVDDRVREAIEKFKELGATVEEVSIPEHLMGGPIFIGISSEGWLKNVIQSHSFGPGNRGLYLHSLMQAFSKWKEQPDQLPISGKLIMLMGEFISNKYGGLFYAKAQNLNRKLKQAIEEKLKEFDILIMPTTPFSAPSFPGEDATMDEYLYKVMGMLANTAVFNCTGHPALNVPIAKVDGLPIGMMLVSKHYHEASIYKAAYAWEQGFDWTKIN